MDGLGTVPGRFAPKVERADKADAQQDLDDLLALRGKAVDPAPRRQRSLTFNEVIDAWFEAGCPNVGLTKLMTIGSLIFASAFV